jgi:hypothetical protein
MKCVVNDSHSVPFNWKQFAGSFRDSRNGLQQITPPNELSVASSLEIDNPPARLPFTGELEPLCECLE